MRDIINMDLSRFEGQLDVGAKGRDGKHLRWPIGFWLGGYFYFTNIKNLLCDRNYTRSWRYSNKQIKFMSSGT